MPVHAKDFSNYSSQAMKSENCTSERNLTKNKIHDFSYIECMARSLLGGLSTFTIGEHKLYTKILVFNYVKLCIKKKKKN